MSDQDRRVKFIINLCKLDPEFLANIPQYKDLIEDESFIELLICLDLPAEDLQSLCSEIHDYHVEMDKTEKTEGLLEKIKQILTCIIIDISDKDSVLDNLNDLPIDIENRMQSLQNEIERMIEQNNPKTILTKKRIENLEKMDPRPLTQQFGILKPRPLSRSREQSLDIQRAKLSKLQHELCMTKCHEECPDESELKKMKNKLKEMKNESAEYQKVIELSNQIFGELHTELEKTEWKSGVQLEEDKEFDSKVKIIMHKIEETTPTEERRSNKRSHGDDHCDAKPPKIAKDPNISNGFSSPPKQTIST